MDLPKLKKVLDPHISLISLDHHSAKQRAGNVGTCVRDELLADTADRVVDQSALALAEGCIQKCARRWELLTNSKSLRSDS